MLFSCHAFPAAVGMLGVCSTRHWCCARHKHACRCISWYGSSVLSALSEAAEGIVGEGGELRARLSLYACLRPHLAVVFQPARVDVAACHDSCQLSAIVSSDESCAVAVVGKGAAAMVCSQAGITRGCYVAYCAGPGAAARSGVHTVTSQRSVSGSAHLWLLRVLLLSRLSVLATCHDSASGCVGAGATVDVWQGENTCCVAQGQLRCTGLQG